MLSRSCEESLLGVKELLAAASPPIRDASLRSAGCGGGYHQHLAMLIAATVPHQQDYKAEFITPYTRAVLI